MQMIYTKQYMLNVKRISEVMFDLYNLYEHWCKLQDIHYGI